MGRPERFLNPELGPVARFANELRELREAAGGPGYRELARRAHYSVATLSQAASGHALPSLAVTLAYVRACGGDEHVWRARWTAISAAVTPKEEEEQDPTDSPYLGLSAFQVEDADRFFGRDELVEELRRRIDESSFVAVFGPSGSGKSSLLRAGLVAALARTPGSADWPVVLVTPGPRPLPELANRLAAVTGAAPGSERVSDLIGRVLADRPEGTRLVLVVDQFEEIFTLCPSEEERARFVDRLVEAAADPAGRVRVVLGVRADFLGRCARYPKLVAALRDRQLLVGPMALEDLRTAIREPAARVDLEVENALVERVIADAGDEPGTLPLISHALLETWKRRSGKTMTLAGYLRAGGVRAGIAHTADRVLAELDPEARRIARDVFLRLTAVGEGVESTRRRVPREELLASADGEAVAAVLTRLAEARLVTMDTETVEVAHEALIRSWPTLRTWLADDRETVLAHRRLTESVVDWEHHDRDDGLLYRGARLATWQDRPLARLNDAERAFLTASRRVVAREQRVRRRHSRLAIAGLGSATVLVTILAVVAMLLAARADDERAVAVSRQLVADARAQLPLDPELGLLLAREAYQASPNPETESVLRQAVVDSHVRATLPIPPDKSRAPEAVTGAEFSPDGKLLVTTSAYGTVRVWEWGKDDVTRTEPRVLRSPFMPTKPVFGPDGRHIAMATSNGVVVADWASGAEPAALPGYDGAVWDVAFGPDGRLAAACDDGAVRVWDSVGDTEPEVLPGHEGPVRGVAISADGQWLASVGEDSVVRVRDLVGGGEPMELLGHASWIKAVVFSPDGRHLATAGFDGAVRVWDLADGGRQMVLGDHGGNVESLAYSRDGRSIVSAGDGTARVWSADRLSTPVVLRGHHGTVLAATFGPDGRTVVSGSTDGTAKVWDIDEVDTEAVLRGHEGLIWSLAPTGDGRQVVSGGLDGTMWIWSTDGTTDPVAWSGVGTSQPVTRVALSPDGRQLAAVGADGVIIIWATKNPTAPIVMRGPGMVSAVAFSPDGKQIATDMDNALWLLDMSDEQQVTKQMMDAQTPVRNVAWGARGHIAAAAMDGTVVVWDPRTKTKRVLPGRQGQILTLVFSADGRRLASGGVDGTIHIWNVEDIGEPLVLHDQLGAVWSATFSPDGRHLVTTGGNAAVRIWRTDGVGEPLVLDGFHAPTRAVAALGGNRYATAHDDGTVRIWRCDACGPIGQVLDRADRHVTRELTAVERRTYLAAHR